MPLHCILLFSRSFSRQQRKRSLIYSHIPTYRSERGGAKVHCPIGLPCLVHTLRREELVEEPTILKALKMRATGRIKARKIDKGGTYKIPIFVARSINSTRFAAKQDRVRLSGS